MMSLDAGDEVQAQLNEEIGSNSNSISIPIFRCSKSHR